ncbi:MAG: L,D-transpeptidase [Anaerolineales bacterium]|nr:L,D-transpeptidase [Anaerolineales bacterium]
MTKTPEPAQRSLLYPILIILFITALVIGVTAWTAKWAPVMSLNNIPTPTHAQFFGIANIAKPTHTALPTLTPLPTALPISSPMGVELLSSTPESLVSAEIVDTSPVIQNPSEVHPVPSYGGNKYILVDISEQHMYVYEGDVAVYSFVASTGMNNATRVGTFSVLEKIPNAYGATWNIWMPNWLGIYWSGSLQNGIHALPIMSNGATLWEGYLGIPISYGCVVLGTYESQLLYDWADVGTPVEIQW